MPRPVLIDLKRDISRISPPPRPILIDPDDLRIAAPFPLLLPCATGALSLGVKLQGYRA
jgi:hypothetical protein